MTASDTALVQKLLDSTVTGKVAWEPSGITDQFKCNFVNKWTVTVDKGYDDESDATYFWLTLIDFAKGTELLRLYSTDVPSVPQLFEVARRQALRIDEAISDLLRELDK